MKRSMTPVLTVVAMLASSTASAHHVVWLDFSDFDLNPALYGTVDGVTPGAAQDNRVRDLIVQKMVEDYAPFDIYFTTFQPTLGRYTHVRFDPSSEIISGIFLVFGSVGTSCNTVVCTGVDSWEDPVSRLEVFLESFPVVPEFKDTTSGRIAQGMANVASHELGHILGLRHCNAQGDSNWNCSNEGSNNSSDNNVTEHLMVTDSLGMTAEMLASTDMFFSVQSSRRSLFRDLMTRNHWAPLPNVNGGAGWADVIHGDPSLTAMFWWRHLATSSGLGGATFEGSIGRPGDIFLTGDMNGDGKDDLVFGRIVSTTAVQWWVALAVTNGFAAPTRWTSDSGAPGAIYRIGDLDDDGRDDLFFGRPTSANTVQWKARRSTGTSLGATITLIGDAGDRDDIFLAGDVTGDGRTDLIVKRNNGTDVFRSTGSTFVFDEGDSIINFNPDYIMVEDVTDDGRADLVTGHVVNDTQVRIKVRESNGCGNTQCFSSVDTWLQDGGNAGDALRMGDSDGDGDADLFALRAAGQTSFTATPDRSILKWFRARSLTTSFATGTVWTNDAGAEGHIVP